MTGSVFISYRREDSSGYARAIYNQLRGMLGAENIFMDVDAIEPGLDFVKVIEDAVGGCEVLLALIGPSWLEAEQGGASRLHGENDYVRTEIATALERDIRVIPVLLGGAEMPQGETLPQDLKPLLRRNAVEIRHAHFDSDLAGLAKVLARVVKADQAEPVQRTSTAEPVVDEQVRNSPPVGARKWQKWGLRLLLPSVYGFLTFLFVVNQRVRSGSGSRTVDEEVALVVAVVTVLVLYLAVLLGDKIMRRHWWGGVLSGVLIYAVLGFVAGSGLDWLRVTSDGPLAGAIFIWCTGAVILLVQALRLRKQRTAGRPPTT